MLRTLLRRLVLNRVWYVHSGAMLTVRAAPGEITRRLTDAAKPSQQRLHLRDLFAGGRHYYLLPNRNGFRLTTNNRGWTRRSRTAVAAVLNGRFFPVNEDVTNIHMQTRIRPVFMIGGVFVPLFMTWLIFSTHWALAIKITLSLTLFALSWIWRRLEGALQANEMVFFVQKALEDLSHDLPTLNTMSNVVDSSRDFAAEWQRFYEEHKGEYRVCAIVLAARTRVSNSPTARK